MNKILKNKPLKGTTGVSIVWRQAPGFDLIQPIPRTQISQEGQGSAASPWWGSMFHVSWWAAGGKEKGRQSSGCAPASSLHHHGRRYFLCYPRACLSSPARAPCARGSSLLPPHPCAERLRNGQLHVLILLRFPVLFSLCFSSKLCRQHY